VNDSLKSAASKTKTKVKNQMPEADKDTTGFKTSSRNVKRGQLKRSLKSGLRTKAAPNRNTFLSAVWFQEGQGKGKKTDDGFFAKWYFLRHKANAFGFSGGRQNKLKQAVSSAKPTAQKTIGEQLASKIAAFGQAKVNKL
jgi:hypothetical protein